MRVETNTINTITSTNASTLLNLHDGSIRRDRNPIYLSLIVSTLCFVLVAITFIDRKDYSRSFGFNDIKLNVKLCPNWLQYCSKYHQDPLGSCDESCLHMLK